MKYAGFWKRFMASILDFLVLALPIIAISWALPYAGGVVLCLLYYPIFESSSIQATPGKYWMGLKVLNENGQPLTFYRALARFLLKYVSTMILMLGYLIQLFTAKRQTLHDLIVHAVVIDQAGGTEANPDWFAAWMQNMRYVLRVDESAPQAAAPAADVQATTNPSSAVSSIEKLHELYKNGVLTEEEFQNKKSELLKQI